MIGNNIIWLESVGSTNLSAIELCKNENIIEGTVVIAVNQHSGRGQKGTTWESEPGKNIAISIILYPSFLTGTTIFYLSEAIAISIVEFLNETVKATFKIKWPNDIVFGNKKICGILIENIFKGEQASQSVVGIGINVNQTVFEKYIPEAISMHLITDQTFNVSDCIAQLCSKINYYYELLKSGEYEKIHQRYLENLFHFNELRFYNIDGKLAKGTIVNVQPDGKLEMKLRDGSTRFFDTKKIRFVYD